MQTDFLRIISNHVILPVADPAKFRQMFPSVKIAPLGASYIAALPHTLETTRLVTNLGYRVASPLATNYSWPGRFKPFLHQKVTTEFLILNKRAYCLSGMGCGKTASALWATDFLMRQGEVQKTLIVAPLSTLERVWAQEIFQVLPHRRYHVLHGARQKRLDLLNDRKVDFYVINHDGVELIEEALEKRPDINHVIIDESATLRNSRTKRWKVYNRILNRQGIVRSAWGMTGTPTPNAPTDCFGQVKLITPERYTGSFTSMQMELMIKVGMFKWVPKKDSAERVHKYMQPSIRYALEDCIDLPPTIYQEREVELSAEQQKHYREMQQKALAEIRGETITAVNAGVVMSKLLQASVGIMYTGNSQAVEMDFSPRLKVLKEVIEECNEKVIVFVPFTAALNRFYDELKKQWTVAVVDGSVSAGKRNTIFRDFQMAKDPRILLAHPKTMAHGLTLTAATTIVWASPTTSTDFFLQANARIARPGQKNVTHIVMLHGSEVERKLYQTLKDRRKLQELVLDLVKGGGV
jgi:SNF2 family DNA or RNA helicase